MTPELHARIRDIFLQAVALDPNEREPFLRQACADSPEVLNEVLALLKHHQTETILADNSTDVGAQFGNTAAPDRALAETRTYVPLARTLGAVVSKLFGTRQRRVLALVLAALALAVLGHWTHTHVKRATRFIIGEQLRSLLNADIRALDEWVAQCRTEAEAWAADEHLVRCVQRLIEASASDQGREPALRSAPAQQELTDMLQPYLHNADSAATVVIDHGGVILSSSFSPLIGKRLNGAGIGALTRIFAGERVFLGPHLRETWISFSGELRDTPRLTWTIVPIYNPQEKAIAVLGLGTQADLNFADILAVAQMGQSGETYAFDEEGRLLSHSRFDEQLKRIGLLPDSAEARSMLTIEIRDPGGDLTRGYQPARELSARPFTEVAALAIASRRKEDPEAQHGLLIEPYRDYRGVPVIGAWRWLPRYRFAVASEVDVVEADAPLRYMEIAFAVLFGVLTLSSGAALASSFSVVRLRRQIGQVLRVGPYTLLKQIGAGGMGRVFLARHALLKRPTAIKMLKQEGEISNMMLARFEREVQLASQLTHPNTIEIYDFGRTPEGSFYCAMEFIDGPMLNQLVEQHGSVIVARTIHILRQVCGSLSEAHSLGLVHRDIKPQNIALCRRGGQFDVVKVLDFGLAKNIMQPEQLEITTDRQLVGTPLYMAPERFQSRNGIDARSDIYSLGGVAFYLLTGTNVFQEKTVGGIIRSVMDKTPERPSARSIFPIPAALDQLVLDCLAKHPDDRPQSVQEVLSRLDLLAEEKPWNQVEASAWWAASWRNQDEQHA